MLIINKMYQLLLNLLLTKRSTYRVVLIGIFVIASNSILLSAEQVDKSTKYSTSLAYPPRHADRLPEGGYKRIKEEGGTIIIDGSLQVLEQSNVKTWDLVEISTPVTPAANHARIFLRADTTKSSLVILFDDGTSFRIAGN
jgi:hypothetical protein